MCPATEISKRGLCPPRSLPPGKTGCVVVGERLASPQPVHLTTLPPPARIVTWNFTSTCWSRSPHLEFLQQHHISNLVLVLLGLLGLPVLLLGGVAVHGTHFEETV